MRKTYSKELKFKVALESLKGNLTIADIVSRFQVPESVVHRWHNQLLESGAELFISHRGHDKQDGPEIDQLHATIGRLKVENDFLEKALGLLARRYGSK